MSLLLLVMDIVIMCRNDVIIDVHYYVFLHIIYLCTSSYLSVLAFLGRSIIDNNR